MKAIVCKAWGLPDTLVVTPTLESEGALSLGLGPEQRRRLFKFADADGSVLAIVGEKTVPVARLAAGRRPAQTRFLPHAVPCGKRQPTTNLLR